MAAASSTVKGALQVGAIRQLGRTGKGSGGFGGNTTLALLGLFGGALLIYAGWKRKPVLSVLAGIAVPTRPSAFVNLKSGAAASGVAGSSGVSNAAFTTSGGGASLGGIFTKANFRGVDEGVDFAGSGPIPALASGTITNVQTGTGWPGGTFITERLDTPAAGHQYVYYAENIRPSVSVGQRVGPGVPVGIAGGSYPYTEEGFAAAATGDLAAAHGHYTNHQPTPEGNAFKAWLGI